jgi:uncharacterized membrane protein
MRQIHRGHRFAWHYAAAWALCALALRLFRLNAQSIWYDEAITLTAAKLSARALVGNFAAYFSHPPLHEILLKAWLEVWGFGDLQARLLSAILGSLAVATVYALAEYLFDRRTAMLAAMLAAISQLGMVYSQEARPYALLLLLTVLAAYCFAVSWYEHSAAAWWGFVLVTVLVFYTHYHGLLIPASLVLFALVFRKGHPLPRRWWIGGALAALLLCGPWVALAGAAELTQWHGYAFDAQPEYSALPWYGVFSILNWFNNGRWSGIMAPASWASFLFGVVALTGAAVYGLKDAVPWRSLADDKQAARRERVVVLVFAAAVPVLVVTLAAIFHVVFAIRYISFAVWPYYLLVAHGMRSMRPPVLAAAVFAALVAGSMGLRAAWYIPYKENYRDALSYLAVSYQPGDCAVFVPLDEPPLQWSIYHPASTGLRMPAAKESLSDRTGCQRLWVVTYSRLPEMLRRFEPWRRDLNTRYRLAERRRYFWVDVELFRAAPQSQ